MNIVLFEPEIPPNTGNIIRLCANTNCRLHLIKPLGFSLENKRLRRAGLDYDEFTELDVHENLNAFIKKVKPRNIYGLTTKGSIEYSNINFLDQATQNNSFKGYISFGTKWEFNQNM